MADDLLTEEARAASFRASIQSRIAFQSFLQQSVRGSRSAYAALLSNTEALIPPFHLPVGSYELSKTEIENNGYYDESRDQSGD